MASRNDPLTRMLSGVPARKRRPKSSGNSGAQASLKRLKATNDAWRGELNGTTARNAAAARARTGPGYRP